MTILVLGGSGVIGRSLCRRLVAEHGSVLATTRQPSRVPAISGVRWVPVDLATFNQWEQILRGVVTVYHLAWSTVPSSAELEPAIDFSVNGVGTLRLLEAARRRPDLRVVFASSGGAVYGRTDGRPVCETTALKPVSAYGFCKAMVESCLEQYRRVYGLDVVSLRIGNCVASDQLCEKGLGAVTLFLKAGLAGRPVEVFGKGEMIRDFIFVRDIVDALVAAGERKGVNGAINIGSGVGHRISDVIRAVEAAIGVRLEVHHRPARPFDVPSIILDNRKAKAELGWAPKISFEDGVKAVASELGTDLRIDPRCTLRSSRTVITRTTTMAPKLTPEALHMNSRVAAAK